MKAFLLLLSCLFSLVFPVFGSQIEFDVAFSANWARGELFGQTGFNLAQADLRLPTGRFLGEQTLRQSYPQLLQPYLLSLRVDSSTVVRDLVDSGDITLDDLYLVSMEAGRTPPSLSTDLERMTSRFTIHLEKISSLLVNHRRANLVPRPINPVTTQDYSGIIILASDELPIRGRMTRAYLEPCLFPKIWDSEMNLIYDLSMFEGAGLIARYAAPESIFRPNPTGLDAELTALVGTNPLRIFAREAFGINPTDPVIHRDDAMRIISSPNNRRLLSEGRIVIVLNENQIIRSIN